MFSYFAINKTNKSAVILASNGDETHPEFESQIQILGNAALGLYLYSGVKLLQSRSLHRAHACKTPHPCHLEIVSGPIYTDYTICA